MATNRPAARRGPAGVGPFAIHPNGPLYYVDQNNTLIGLDIGLGSGPGTTVAGTPGYPTVLLDGSVVVPSVLDPQQFQLTFVRPDGAVETQVIASPSAYLSSAGRAIPNGQGGLLVQLHRWLWREMSSEVWDFDTLVVGVDAAGNVTGSEPLGADWGEIVVGEGGTVLATSTVTYWTEPFYGGVRKQHVGMVTPLTPAGNRAAFPTFFGPSGPCGWAWDGIGERWYYNGDCDQAVISITSIAARGSDTIVTLSDGRVFGPGALSQLHLSYLVPAADGTYLGAGVAAGATVARRAASVDDADALVNIAVTSGEPVSPFGPVWPAGGGGGLDHANAANPPSGVKLLGDVETRAREVWVFQDALLQDPEVPRNAGDYLWDNDGFLDIKEVSIDQFKGLGTLVRELVIPRDTPVAETQIVPIRTSVANDIGNLVRPAKGRLVVEFGLTENGLGRWGGARTLAPGETASRIASGLGSGNPQVQVNLSELRANNLYWITSTFSRARFYGQSADTSPNWTVKDFVAAGPDDDHTHIAVVLWHELGHAWGIRRGGNRQDGETDQEAWNWENLMRFIKYGAFGVNNAPRRHE